MSAPRDWDAATYDRVADPQTRWGTAVLDRLPLVGDETVVDAGCGSGRVTEARLAAAGFVDIETWLQPEPTRFEPGEPLEAFLRTVILGGHVARLPAGERDAFVRRVAERMAEPVVDYVRLNVTARLAPEAE